MDAAYDTTSISKKYFCTIRKAGMNIFDFGEYNSLSVMVNAFEGSV